MDYKRFSVSVTIVPSLRSSRAIEGMISKTVRVLISIPIVVLSVKPHDLVLPCYNVTTLLVSRSTGPHSEGAQSPDTEL